MKISIDRNRRHVVWRMTPEEARDVARWMDEVLVLHDDARHDAIDTVAAADQLEPTADGNPSVAVTYPTRRSS